MLVAGTGFSAVYPGLVAVAQRAGRPGAAGPLEAALAAGSVLGGLWWARRGHTRRRSLHLTLLTALLAAGLVAAATFAAGLIPLGVGLGLTGMALAPLFVVAYLAADDFVEPARRTEAGTWVNVAANAGIGGRDRAGRRAGGRGRAGRGVAGRRRIARGDRRGTAGLRAAVGTARR